MALLTREEIVAALERLGELADAEGETVHLIIVGGAAMVLGYSARPSTHDVDVLILPPTESARVRGWAKQIADELEWPDDWLNDAAKGFLIGLSSGPTLLQSSGIEVRSPAAEQLLAMKLSAWRDEVDIADANRLLDDLQSRGAKTEIWRLLEPYLVPGAELKAAYAFDDLWESRGSHG